MFVYQIYFCSMYFKPILDCYGFCFEYLQHMRNKNICSSMMHLFAIQMPFTSLKNDESVYRNDRDLRCRLGTKFILFLDISKTLILEMIHIRRKCDIFLTKSNYLMCFLMERCFPFNYIKR